MDNLLMRAQLADAEIILFEDLKKTGTYASPHSAFSSGASVVINHVDKLWPRINELCCELGRTFRHTYANLYLTPPESQTAPPHSDDRDVLVLQMHGCKRWRVWARGTCGTTCRPFANEQAGKEEGAPPLDPRALGPAELEVTLEPGAILYIPRGAMHVAQATGTECSLHLTTAVPTADNCWSGYVLHAVAAQCFDERRFRLALPFGPWPAIGARRLPGRAMTAPAAAEAAEAAAAEAAAAEEAGASFAPSAALGVWREQSRELWREMHAAVGLAEARAELSTRMRRHRQTQRNLLKALEARLAAREAGASRAPHEPITTLSLWPRTRLRKVVRLELIRPGSDRPDDGKRVAQAHPEPSGPGRLAYIHTPPALLRPMKAFEGWPVGHTFELRELPARDAFLRACAARALMGIDVLEVVDGGRAFPSEAKEREAAP